MPLGTRIRKARKQARISQAELARHIGISKR
jgi:transcriptional regulator with XRE-family HTH domain